MIYSLYIVCTDSDHYEQLEQRAAFSKCLPNEVYSRYSPTAEEALEEYEELRFYVEGSIVEQFQDQVIKKDGPDVE
tara:strand:+ start:1865 stop:2092 length:228 start_codon:yes stop_codon:yes gene_type:complete